MFIRWKKRMTCSKKWYKNYKQFEDENGKWHTIPKSEDEKTNLLAAYLCTSVRIDGKPRQKALYLASINYKYLDEIGHQAPFWQHTLAKLEGVSLSPAQRQSIEESLVKRVPRPSEEAIARNEAEFQAFMQAMTSRIKGRS